SNAYQLHNLRRAANGQFHQSSHKLGCYGAFARGRGNSNPHPYWYARVLGIFHADIGHLGLKSKSRRPKHMEFLWVRWFGRDLSHKSGCKAKRLDRLGFVDSADPAAFGFLNPAEVIRASHIIPAFRYGRTSDLLPKSIARHLEDEDQDYTYY
ncbi:hypothetical protein DFH08DRAFT_1028214, partial [Mycena albidolilacea]